MANDNGNDTRKAALSSTVRGLDVDMSDASNLHLVARKAPARDMPTHVYDTLYEAILSGVIAPGERLMVDEVAAHFGVSKIPVREALKALAASGWVQIRPHRGTFVRPLSSQELRQVFEMRRVLEPYCARLAAGRRTEEHVRELKALVKEGMEAVRDGDVVRTTAVNSRFHNVMAGAVANDLIFDTVTGLEARMRRYFIAVDWKQRRESMSQHKAIMEAIRDGDGDEAERLTLAHLEHTEALAFSSVRQIADG
ncbi:GntR family transcriptional regulator [Ramlibacter sp.]|uniref:GntR family transcriptional regulator n=1 Tax=Ramlibacter sp. TaxID=1917967 RepID=UPI003D14D49A